MNLIDSLRSLSVETGSLVCLGCGYEHNCSIHGCAIIRAAVDLLKGQSTQLTASQQRERAAVEDFILAAKETQDGIGVCVVCKHYPADMGHGMPSICDECAGSEHCMFEWRGPQEAGEEKE